MRFTDTPDHAGWIYKCRKLYTTPPAPIALEAIENAIEYIRSIAFHINEDDYHGKHIAYFMLQALAWLEGHSCSDDRLGKAENQPVRGNQAAESNRGNEWTGNPDIDNAIIMLDRIDTLESCDDDRIEAVKAVLRRLAGNSPVIPSEVLSAILKFARVRADFDDFDGDRRGIGDCLDETEHELIVTINKYASQLAVKPVVPVGLDERAAFNAWNNDENLPIAGVGAKNAAWLAWQARAELGRSLVVNYPVTPDGWISCSERMPNTKTAVLVAVEFDRKGDWRMKWATYIPGHPDANDGWIIPGASWKPSHWMPLPEPPQEVNQ
ncbi:DUF551 domain-containing protein [Escherichia coli]|uniref:DUF551 domain-containing protein n=1 Tax=Escherichia coli TaxID=562 RepID=UPI00208DB416|nr:DUF551 domain-containing protein [Escherichia coli]